MSMEAIVGLLFGRTIAIVCLTGKVTTPRGMAKATQRDGNTINQMKIIYYYITTNTVKETLLCWLHIGLIPNS